MATAQPSMRELAGASVRALSRFDVDALETLVEHCEALRRQMQGMPPEEWKRLFFEAQEALQPMRNFARALETTAANLEVLANLSDLRAGRLEYGRRRSRQ